jgi:cysteinyl-tRNA synthetase
VRDFALWKAAKPEDEMTGAAWDSPWGRGRPGWHLECSAMARRYLGDTLDLHCGAVDLIFPHHEDEIAQSEGATGVTFSRLWCHGEFLLTEGAKMAKRVGNVTTIAGLREEGITAAVARHFLFTAHYRTQLNLTEDALDQAIAASRRIGTIASRLAEARGGTEGLAIAAGELRGFVTEALFDDLNAPQALAALHTFITRANSELDKGGSDVAALERAREALAWVDSIMSIVPVREADDPELASWVEERLGERQRARAKRDFARADGIRAELESRGVAIEDTPGGTKWRRKS